MGRKLYIGDNTLSTKRDTLPITLSRDSSTEIKDQNYFINIGISFFIYLVVFLVFYFFKNKSLYFNPDNLKLLGLFLLSVIISAILSKKINYIKRYEYSLTLGKLFLSLLINLVTLILLLNLFEIQNKMPTYLLGTLFCGLVIETFYFLMLGSKGINNITLVRFKKSSIQYLLFDLLILTFFLLVNIILVFNHITLNETKFILIFVILISWVISAASTHRFLPLIISNTKQDAFELQVKFYLKFIVLSFLSLMLLRLDFLSSIQVVKGILGYSLFSSLISMFIFAPKVENKTDEPTVRFLKPYKIKEHIISSHAVNLDSKYSFTGIQSSDLILKNKIEFEYLKDYEEVFTVLNSMLDLKSFDMRKAIIIKSDEPNNISLQQPNSYQLFINLHILNDQSELNNYLRNIRNSLVEGGVFVGALHPHLYRYIRFIKKYKFWIGNILYFLDLIWKRVFPKLPITRVIYSTFRKDKDQAISLAEGLGRLVYTGYKILDLAVLDDVVYFAAVKDKALDPENKSFYSPIFKMNKIGQHGKEISVYKLRTMYPYAEYMQDYILKVSGYSNIGKPAQDFRLPFWGRVFRKYWLDEIPQLVNVLKGEMKLVGARPLSKRVYNDYPLDLRKIRDKYKPGCIPPYVSLMMQSMDESIKAERIYFKNKSEHPYLTDIKYFFAAFYNIFIKKMRSA